LPIGQIKDSGKDIPAEKPVARWRSGMRGPDTAAVNVVKKPDKSWKKQRFSGVAQGCASRGPGAPASSRP
jgi:hypothetical protein